jgi:DNA-binding beta-propeller fold protein YncE
MVNWLVGAAEKPEIRRPYSTAQDSLGRLLIADPDERGIHIFDFEKQKYQFLTGPKGDELLSPIEIACDDNDDIYVTDSVRAKIFVFNSQGRLLRTIGGPATEPRFARPTGMALDRAARRLYVVDTLRHQLLVLGLDGSLIRAIGQRGTAKSEFNYPTGVALSGGKVFVVDALNFRIQTFTSEGVWLNSFGRPGNKSGTLYRPKGIAADNEGHLYVVDGLFETVQVFDVAGQLLYYFGSSGTGPGQFQLPAGISINNRNIIYVADSQNRRVQVFRYRRAGE